MKYVFTFVMSIGISLMIGVVVYNAIPKTAFVDNRQLFQAFQGKKELETRLEQARNKQKSVIDSIELKIRAIQELAQTDEIARKRLFIMQRQYEQLTKEHQSQYQQQSQEFTEAIWKQITQYTIEYGEQEGYDYVFGIAGQGTLMYGKKHYNITQEVTEYINSKYAGN